MSNTGWVIDWRWRSWMFGFTFGPEVWQLSLGPLSVGFDPEMWKLRQAHEDFAKAYPATLDEAVEKLEAYPYDPPTEED